jgi:hypothetical protein
MASIWARTIFTFPIESEGGVAREAQIEPVE